MIFFLSIGIAVLRYFTTLPPNRVTLSILFIGFVFICFHSFSMHPSLFAVETERDLNVDDCQHIYTGVRSPLTEQQLFRLPFKVSTIP